MGFDLDPSYVDVAERIATFREKHPDGSLQQVAVDFREFGGTSWVIFTAAAYRDPEDPRPGHGTAWEQVPGKTPYTKGSELQNAETAAWGRAIVAALAADTKRGIASGDEVRNRRTETPQPAVSLRDQLWAASVKRDETLDDAARKNWLNAEVKQAGSVEALLRAWAS